MRPLVSRDLPSLGLNRPRRLALFGNTRRDGEAGSGGQCSIAPMKRLLAWLLGGFALFGFLRRRREPPAVADPRAAARSSFTDPRRRSAARPRTRSRRGAFEASWLILQCT